MIIYKHVLLSCLCMLAVSNILSMDEFRRKIDDLKAGQNFNMDDLIEEGRKLTQGNRANYKKAMLFLHPDKTGNNAILNELCKKLTDNDTGNKPQNRTKEEDEFTNLTTKTDQYNNTSQFLKEYSPFDATFIGTAEYAQRELLKKFINNIIGTAFTLLTDRLMPEDAVSGEVQKIAKSFNKKLEKCKKDQTNAYEGLKVHAEYQVYLQEHTTKTDQKSQQELEKLRKLLNKEKK